MLNYIPVIGWLLSLIFNISLAIPFWFIWTYCGLGIRYFYFLPERYLDIPFWNCVGLFMILSIINMLIPKLVSVVQTNNNKS